MSIEECAPSSADMAALIHEQIGYNGGPVDVEGIARGLDILEIHRKPSTGFEGMLLTQREKTDGGIIVNSNSNARRQRFSIAHELGHFLNPAHIPTFEAGFICKEIEASTLDGQDAQSRYQKQENEADSFAIELLAPANIVHDTFKKGIDLGAVHYLAEQLDLSKEAVARRYVDLCQQPIAIVLYKDGKKLTHYWSKAFPYLSVGKGSPIPKQVLQNESVERSFQVAAREWVYKHHFWDLQAQIMPQQEGYGMVLLVGNKLNAAK